MYASSTRFPLTCGHGADLFFRNFSSAQVGQKPVFVSIDGGVAQTTNQSFGLNGESDLDLEYAMVLTHTQPVQLLQTGDVVEGAGFDNWLDAVDGSFCTFEGASPPCGSADRSAIHSLTLTIRQVAMTRRR